MCDLFHIFTASPSLYCDRNNSRWMATDLTKMNKNSRENKAMDSPLSESNVSLKLSLIQKRCNELMNETDGLELILEDPEPSKETGDPYNQLK